jgi:hypothetical protein
MGRAVMRRWVVEVSILMCVAGAVIDALLGKTDVAMGLACAAVFLWLVCT